MCLTERNGGHEVSVWETLSGLGVALHLAGVGRWLAVWWYGRGVVLLAFH